MSVTNSPAMPAARAPLLATGEMPGGSRLLQVRGGINLQLRWWLEEERVQVEAEQVQGPGGPCRQQGHLGYRPGLPQHLSLAFGPHGQEVAVEFSLLREPRPDGTWWQLWVSAPCSDSEFLRMELGGWLVEASRPHVEPEPFPFPDDVVEAPGLELFPREAVGGQTVESR